MITWIGPTAALDLAPPRPAVEQGGSTFEREVAATLGSMANRSKVQLYEQIRKAHDREELSIRALAKQFGSGSE